MYQDAAPSQCSEARLASQEFQFTLFGNLTAVIRTCPLIVWMKPCFCEEDGSASCFGCGFHLYTAGLHVFCQIASQLLCARGLQLKVRDLV